MSTRRSSDYWISRHWWRKEIPILNKDLGKPGGASRNRRLTKKEVKAQYGEITQARYFELYGGPDDGRQLPKFIPYD